MGRNDSGGGTKLRTATEAKTQASLAKKAAKAKASKAPSGKKATAK